MRNLLQKAANFASQNGLFVAAALGLGILAGGVTIFDGPSLAHAKKKEKTRKKEASNPDKNTQEMASEDIVLVFTGETDGYLKPCGCASFQLGGLPRRAAHWGKLSKTAAHQVSFSNGSLFEGPGYQNELEATVIAQAYDQMNYEVINFTEREMMYGAAYIRDFFMPIVGAKFVSANYRPPEYQGFIDTHATKIFEVDGKPYTVAITGLYSSFVHNGVYGPEPEIEPAEGLRHVLPQMEDADLKVVLFFGLHDDGKRLAEEFPEIDVIVTGFEEDAPDDEPSMVGDTIVTKTGHRGKYMAAVRVAEPGDGQKLRFEKITVTENEGENESIQSIIKAHNQKVSDLNLLEKKAESEESPDGIYLGSAACMGCHQDEHKIWKHTSHSDAYATLKEINQHRDPECIGCHVVGYPKKSGFVNFDRTPHLIDVGCENCHGPASEHIKNVEAPYKNAKISDCVSCHYDEHDPNFHPDDWERIQHGPEVNEMMLKKIMDGEVPGKDAKTKY